jgi:hypothetical protein
MVCFVVFGSGDGECVACYGGDMYWRAGDFGGTGIGKFLNGTCQAKLVLIFLLDGRGAYIVIYTVDTSSFVD